LLCALEAACRPRLLVGCSSAGEFTCTAEAVGSARAVALRSAEMQFAAGLGHGLRADRAAATQAVAASASAAEAAGSATRGAVQ
jgi:hypothetical protein